MGGRRETDTHTHTHTQRDAGLRFSFVPITYLIFPGPSSQKFAWNGRIRPSADAPSTGDVAQPIKTRENEPNSIGPSSTWFDSIPPGRPWRCGRSWDPLAPPLTASYRPLAPMLSSFLPHSDEMANQRRPQNNNRYLLR